MSDLDLLSISDVSAVLNRSVDTLRRWDKQGWLKPSVRMWDGTRLYKPDYIRHFHSLWSTGASPQDACSKIYEQYHQDAQSA